MITKVNESGEWIEGSPTYSGQIYRKYFESGGFAELIFTEIVKEYGDIPIIVTGVTGDLMHNSSFTDITCYELTDIHLTGEVEVPDQMFRLPVQRSDGKTTIFIVDVVNGMFDAVLNFPTSGDYVYTNKEANAKFKEPLFNVAPISITVARQTGV